MRLRRVAVLNSIRCSGLITEGLALVGLLFFLGVATLTLGVGWDGRRISFLTVPLDGYGVGGGREETISFLLVENYSWAWLIVGMAYVLPTLLLPLASSYSLSETMWLRLLPCEPREVALARVCRVAAVSGVSTLLSLVWVAVCVVYHKLPAGPLLTAVLGFQAHLLWSSGLVAVSGNWLRTGTDRAVVAIGAMLLPLIAFMIFLAAGRRLPATYKAWIPYAAPFTHTFGRATTNFAMGAAIGLALILWSVVGARGRLVRFPNPSSGGEREASCKPSLS